MIYRQLCCNFVLAITLMAGGGVVSCPVVHAQAQNGVIVEPDGVLRMHTISDPGGRLTLQRIAAARATLDREVAAPSKLRKISLNRLEQAVANMLSQGQAPTDAMQNLAGLTRAQFVFFLPESNDIVIAGPAEGWAADLSGRVLGIESGQPVILLEDLVVALRAFSPAGRSTALIGCSIDPTTEGLANMQAFLRRVGGQATPAQTRFIAKSLRDSLGLQDVRVMGVSPKTHFAQVLVEADYRMKLIGIGMEKTKVKLDSYVDLARPGAGRRNALQRWYFVPDYQCVRVNGDRTAMQLVGKGVKLVGTDELVTDQGDRAQSNQVDRAAAKFVQGFTAKYLDLASSIPIYAQLRNMIDLSIAAAYIQQEDFYGKAGWLMDVFGDESALAVETHNAPVKVESAVGAVWKGRTLMTPIGGGVRIEPRQALSPGNVLEDDPQLIDQMQAQIRVDQLAEGVWWWD